MHGGEYSGMPIERSWVALAGWIGLSARVSFAGALDAEILRHNPVGG
jgi:hypothetical protein